MSDDEKNRRLEAVVEDEKAGDEEVEDYQNRFLRGKTGKISNYYRTL